MFTYSNSMFMFVCIGYRSTFSDAVGGRVEKKGLIVSVLLGALLFSTVTLL